MSDSYLAGYALKVAIVCLFLPPRAFSRNDIVCRFVCKLGIMGTTSQIDYRVMTSFREVGLTRMHGRVALSEGMDIICPSLAS